MLDQTTILLVVFIVAQTIWLILLLGTSYLKKRTKTHIIDISVVDDNIATQAYRLSLSKSNL